MLRRLTRWWTRMRLRTCEATSRRLARAAALHRLSDASVKRAALDQVDRTQQVHHALRALLAQMDEARGARGRPHPEDPHHAPARDPA